MRTEGALAISRPTSTFCTLPPDIRRTGNSVLGVTTSSSFQISMARALGSLRLTKTPCPFLQERSIMFPVMPMEPTRPMPSRSSGTKAMATPAFLICMGVLPTRFEGSRPSGV